MISNRDKKIKALVAILIFINLAIWIPLYASDTKDVLKVSFLDVGQGDAVLIESTTGVQVLIDAGVGKVVLSELSRMMNFGDRYIDIILATHPDTDHIGGIPYILERYEVGLFLDSGLHKENSASMNIQNDLKKFGIEEIEASSGMRIDLGDGAVLLVLYPNTDTSGWQANDASVILRLDHGENSFLFTGDAELKSETDMIYHISPLLDVDVLKVGHHGSKTSSSEIFLDAVTPEYAVISAGKDNKYGHPDSGVVERLKSTGAVILGTFDEGSITFESDGVSIKKK